MTPDPDRHPSTLRLHQLRLGELDPAEAAALHAHVRGCARCSGRAQHQLALAAELRAAPVPTAILAAARPGPWERLRAWWAGLGQARLVLPVLAAAAVTLTLLPGQVEPQWPGLTTDAVAVAVPDTRTKGHAPVLEAWVQTGGSARPVYTDEALAPGTRVQLKYNPGARRFVTLAGRDGAGRVEVYGTIPVRAAGVQAAPFALTLDATEGAQRFYAVLTDARPEAEALASSLARDPVSVAGAEVAEVVVRKKGGRGE